MTVWDKVQELMYALEDMTPKQIEFVENLFQNLDPNNAREEMTERQFKYLSYLHEKYVLGNEEGWQ